MRKGLFGKWAPLLAITGLTICLIVAQSNGIDVRKHSWLIAAAVLALSILTLRASSGGESPLTKWGIIGTIVGIAAYATLHLKTGWMLPNTPQTFNLVTGMIAMLGVATRSFLAYRRGQKRWAIGYATWIPVLAVIGFVFYYYIPAH